MISTAIGLFGTSEEAWFGEEAGGGGNEEVFLQANTDSVQRL